MHTHISSPFPASRQAAAEAGGGRPCVFACGIINAKSGLCGENCAFCAQSRYHDCGTPVYPLVPRDVIIRQAERFASAGLRFMGIVISGGAPSAGDFARLCETGAQTAARVDIRLCASFGLLSREQARALREAGFTSCHHNLESARSFYPAVCTTHSFERRAQTVVNAKAAGLRVCSGGIFGLGESWEQRREFALQLRELEVDSIPVNFLTPISGTPLAAQPILPADEALAVITLLRRVHPDRDIIICGGRTRVLGHREALLFQAGANAVMTGDYLTTHGSSIARDKALFEALGLKGVLR